MSLSGGRHALGQEEHDRVRERNTNIHTRTVGNIHILDVSGKIILGQGTMVVRNTIKDLLHNGAKWIVLDLAEVDHIDGSGVGELVSSFTAVVKEGGQLALLNLSAKVHEILAMTGLLTVFQVYDHEQAAVSAAFDEERTALHLCDVRMTASARAALTGLKWKRSTSAARKEPPRSNGC